MSKIVTHANSMVLMMLTILVIIVGGVTWELTQVGEKARALVQHSHRVMELVQDLHVAVTDAETGQRGFLLLNEETYLEPYKTALARLTRIYEELARLTEDDHDQKARLTTLSPLLQRKFDELATTVHLRPAGGLEAALAVVRSDVGRQLMDQIRTSLDAMRVNEKTLMQERLDTAVRREAWVRIMVMGATVLTTLAAVAAMMVLNRSCARFYASEKRQRASVQQLRATLDSLAQGVAVFDADGKLVNWNSEFQRLLNLPKAMMREGMPYAAFIEHTTEAGGTILEEVDGASVDTHYERARTDGTVLAVRRTGTPIRGFVLAVSDMTRPAEAEAVLHEAQRMRTLGQLTSGIAHDFNNLLMVVLGNLEILEKGVERKDGLGIRVKQAATAARRGVELTAHLLRFARHDPLAPAPLHVADTILGMIPLLRRTLGAHIDVQYRVQPGLWTVVADVTRLECALLDLALNARDAMPDGGQLVVELTNHADGKAGGGYVALTVSDTGHGATPGVLEHAFESFRTAQHEGVGLGLASVASFAEQSGGYVETASSTTRGTLARLCLPRATVDAPTRVTVDASAGVTVDTPAPAIPLQVTSTPPLATPATVLLVEDEAAVREIACTMLTDLGHRVLQAVDGEEALRLFGEHATEVDVLLPSLLLPGKVGGLELAERIAAIRPDIRVLFISGYNQATMADRGWDHRAPLIAKPFTRDQLARAVAGSVSDPEAQAGMSADA